MELKELLEKLDGLRLAEQVEGTRDVLVSADNRVKVSMVTKYHMSDAYDAIQIVLYVTTQEGEIITIWGAQDFNESCAIVRWFLKTRQGSYMETRDRSEDQARKLRDELGL